MSAVATAIVGGAVIGAYASGNAASTQADAANNASNMTWAQYQQTREDQAPWRQAGQTALNQIGSMNDQFTHSFNAQDLQSNLAPNYQFQLDQGIGATKNLANASGGLLSGNTLKGINDYAQNYAGNAYQQAFNNYNSQQTNIYNRLSNLAGLGQTANQTTAQSGTQAASNAGNFLTSGAAAQAAGQVGIANSINSGIGNYLGWNAYNSAGSVGGSPSNAQIYNQYINP
jgi:hypothetical protein